MSDSNTDTTTFIGDLDAGVFEQKCGHILSTVAAHVMDHERKGRVVISMDIAKLSSSQVNITHDIAYEHPTMRGKKKENDTTSTPMHVGHGGSMTFFPVNQGQMFTKTGEPATSTSMFPQNAKGVK